MAEVVEELVGRHVELDALNQALVDLDHGRPAAIEIAGEPGIGKTRLLSELAASAEARGHLVLSGAGSELVRDLPFWVFVDAIEEYVQGLGPSGLEPLDDGVRAELATVFPALSALATAPVMLHHERYRSHRAVRALLERLAAERPLVVVLDDLHWADPASVELLGALLHRSPARPVLLALALRPRQVPTRLASALERAYRAETLARLELEPLTFGEACELVGGRINGAEAGALYEESGGNPFYLEQLLRVLGRVANETTRVSLGDAEVPPAVAAALSEELTLLSDGARRILDGASVAGDPFDLDIAAAAAGAPDAAAIDALDELLGLDVVRPTDVPRRFRFRHPLVRRAVYELAPGGWRLNAHERSADALLARGAPASARAHHVELAARPGDLVAVATLRGAGEEVASRAPASAARWFASAVRLLPATAPAEERVELLLSRSEALAATGEYADSHATLLASMAIVPPQARALRVRLTSACARLEHLLGRYEQARARLESALDELGDPNSPESVTLMIELAVDGIYRGDLDAMQTLAARALEAAVALGDQVLVAEALAVRAAAAATRGAGSEAQTYRQQAQELIDELPDEELGRRLYALVQLATADLYLDHIGDAGRHAQRAMTIGRRTGQGDLFPNILPLLGSSLRLQGRAVEAGEVLDGAVEAARLLDNRHVLAWNLFNRSFAAFVAGDIETALATAEESFELARDLDETLVSAYAAMALSDALAEAGLRARAAEVLLTFAGGDELRLIPVGTRAKYFELLTRCFLAEGRRADAERAAESAAACADAVALPTAAAMAGLARAALDLDAGAPARAAEHALAAVGSLEEAGNAFHATVARTRAGRALAQAGAREQAAVELECAAAAFDSFGCTRYRDQAERELRKLGRRIYRRSRPGKTDRGVESLTERELEVARLVADGKSNPEIAGALFLSLKTVETHLRNIFRKLDVTSRLAVAREVDRAGRAERAG